MKKIIILTLLTISTQGYTGTWINEVTSGCALVGGMNYAFTNSNQTQNLMIGCIAGGTVGYVMKEYFKNEAANRYQSKIDTYEAQMDEILTQHAVNNSLGVEGTQIKFNKRRIPSKRLKNGSFQLETFIIEPVIPGNNLIIGD